MQIYLSIYPSIYLSFYLAAEAWTAPLPQRIRPGGRGQRSAAPPPSVPPEPGGRSQRPSCQEHSLSLSLFLSLNVYISKYYLQHTMQCNKPM